MKKVTFYCRMNFNKVYKTKLSKLLKKLSYPYKYIFNKNKILNNINLFEFYYNSKISFMKLF